MNKPNPRVETTDPWTVPLENIDVSRAEVGEVKRNPNNFIRGIAELPVRIRPLRT